MKPSKFGLQGSLKIIKGDATVPSSAGHRIIAHIVNDEGKWGSGFVVSLSKRWPKPEAEYRQWYRSQSFFKLGEIQTVNVQSDTTVVNMIAQHGICTKNDDTPPIRYDSLRECLAKVGELAQDQRSSIHMPRIGCGRSGGSWEEVQKIIHEELIMRGLKVVVYDLEK